MIFSVALLLLESFMSEFDLVLASTLTGPFFSSLALLKITVKPSAEAGLLTSHAPNFGMVRPVSSLMRKKKPTHVYDKISVIMHDTSKLACYCRLLLYHAYQLGYLEDKSEWSSLKNEELKTIQIKGHNSVRAYCTVCPVSSRLENRGKKSQSTFL